MLVGMKSKVTNGIRTLKKKRILAGKLTGSPGKMKIICREEIIPKNWPMRPVKRKFIPT